jgi:hypothetical protein
MINTIGLVLDIFGAFFMIWGEMQSYAAFLSYSGTGEGKKWFDSQLSKLSWWKKLPVELGVAFGSKNTTDMGHDSKFDSLPIKFWGILFLTIGFLLQAIGSFSCQR